MFVFVHTLYMLTLVLESQGTCGAFSLLIVNGMEASACFLEL